MRSNSSSEKRIRRLRSKYRKRTAVIAIIVLIVGIVLGVIVDRNLLKPVDRTSTLVTADVTPTVTPEPTEAPTPEPTEAPTEEPETEPETETESEPEPTEAPEAPEATAVPKAPEATDAPEIPEVTQAAEATSVPEPTEPVEVFIPRETPESEGDEVVAKSGEPHGDDEQQSFTIAMEDPQASAETAATPVAEITPTATPIPEITATPEPTPSPEPTPVPGPTTLAIVPFGESYTFNAEITSDGRARYKIEEGEPYETLTFTLTMKDYLLPSDYSTKWGTKYKLKGTEAGAGFDLSLADYTGSCTIIPQNILTVVLQSESGQTKNPGFQMTDAEINGQNNVEILPNATKTFWKRYTFSNAGEPMEYLSVSSCVNGFVQTVLFELKSDVVPTVDPQTLYKTLTRGDKTDAVIDLQKRLIELGYLSGTADGAYGEMTQTAVTKAQKDFGMEENGTASPEFQARLFAEAEPTPAPEAEPTAGETSAEPAEAAATEASATGETAN